MIGADGVGCYGGSAARSRCGRPDSQTPALAPCAECCVVSAGRLPEVPVVGDQDVGAEEEVGDGVGDDAGAEALGADQEPGDEESPADGGDPLDVDGGEEEGDEDDGVAVAFTDAGELEVGGRDDGAPEEVAPEELFHDGDDQGGAGPAERDEGP